MVWLNYLKLFAIIAMMGVSAVLLHPPFLQRLIPNWLMQRLSSVGQLRDICIMIAFFGAFSLLIQTYVQIVYVLSALIPLTDPMLHGWDLALGLDWFSYFQWVHDRPFVIDILVYAYGSMTFATPIILFVLLLIGRIDCTFIFIHGFFVTALLCTTIGGFFPAHGATTFLINDITVFPNFITYPGNYGVEVINQLRAPTGAVVFDPQAMNGIVTFPSFHTAGTIAMCYALHRTKVRVFAWIYAAFVVASTPVIGAHYFVDILAGLVIGFCVSIGLDRWMRRRLAVFFPNGVAS